MLSCLQLVVRAVSLTVALAQLKGTGKGLIQDSDVWSFLQSLAATQVPGVPQPTVYLPEPKSSLNRYQLSTSKHQPLRL